ncbi:MAG: hypothetical protein K2Y37_02235 [Pirellulales bacterium]|nr:hypothetical protein [Pirellulales bacterium]
MLRTLCILTLLTLAAYLCWSTTEAAGSAAAKQDHSAAAPPAVSPGDASEVAWPLDSQANTKAAPTDSDATETSSTASVGGAFGRTADKQDRVETAHTNEPSGEVTESDDEQAGDTADRDDRAAEPASAGLKQDSGDNQSEVIDEEPTTSATSEERADEEPDSASRTSDPSTDEPEANPAPPAAAPVLRRPLSSDLRALSGRVRRVLNTYYKRRLNSRDHNPWEMMHAIIAYGVHTKIHRGGPKGPTVNAVSYLCWNGTCHGLELLYFDKDRVNARKGPYVQGHYAQLLAILAQSRVPKDYPLRVGDRRFTIDDLIETEKLTCDEGMELTFKLISFAHYCDSDMKWKNDKGDDWDIPRLIKEELRAPILSNAACGGTHRLTALAYAVRARGKQGYKIEGPWLRAQKYLNDYHRYNFSLQNADGSFSTEWFRKREARDDLDRRLQTSGHILEWFVYSLPEEQLTDPRVVKAVKYVSGILAAQPSREWEIGPLGHAIHALVIYDQRVFKAAEAEAVPEPIARAKLSPALPAQSEEAVRNATTKVVEEAVTATDENGDRADEHDADSSSPEATTADSVATGEAAAQPPVDETDATTESPHESSGPSPNEPPAVPATEATNQPIADSPSEVPEIARRGLLRRPFARSPAQSQAPQVDSDPTPAQPTDAGTDVSKSDETPEIPAEQRSPDDGDIECADTSTEMEHTLPPAGEASAPQATEGDSDDSTSASETNESPKPNSTDEGPQLFSAPRGVPLTEPVDDFSPDDDSGPRIEPSSPKDEAPIDEPPPLPGLNIDPPPTSSLEEPSRVGPSIRANEGRILPPPVERVEDEPSDSGAPVKPQPEAKPQPFPTRPQHVAPRGGGSTPNVEAVPPARSRRPRADSRYSRPLPEYSPFSGRQGVPPGRAPSRQLPARPAAPYGTPSRPGDSAIGPRSSSGTIGSGSGRSQTVRPNTGSSSATGRPSSERSMRSLWPWSDDGRSAPSRSRASESSNRARPRPFFFGPQE